MRARFCYILLVLFILVSGCKLQDQQPIDLGNGWAITPKFEPISGSGIIAEAFVLKTGISPSAPAVFIGSTTGNVKPVDLVKTDLALVSVLIPGPIYWQGVEVSVSKGIIKKVEIETDLPGHLQVEVRKQTNQSVSFLATGWGEEVNYCLAYVWIQGEHPVVSWTPEWAASKDWIDVWQVPIRAELSSPTAVVPFRIDVLPEEGAKLLWLDPGSFFPKAYLDGPNEVGEVTVYNVDFAITGPTGAPPNEKVIAAMLADRGYEIFEKALFSKGRLVWKKEARASPPQKKATTWGSLKRE